MIVAWRGPSEYDGAEIMLMLACENRASENTKTGNALPVYVLPAHCAPAVVARNGSDRCVCGDCPMRPSLPRAPGRLPCYVVTGWLEPLWRAACTAPIDHDRALEHLRGEHRPIRWTAYGDIAAVPRAVAEPLLEASATTLGYTRGWTRPDSTWLRAHVCASCMDTDEVAYAQSQGWRTFRSLGPSDVGPSPSERPCANAKGVLCVDCRACHGRGPRGRVLGRTIAQH